MLDPGFLVFVRSREGSNRVLGPGFLSFVGSRWGHTKVMGPGFPVCPFVLLQSSYCQVSE